MVAQKLRLASTVLDNPSQIDFSLILIKTSFFVQSQCVGEGLPWRLNTTWMMRLYATWQSFNGTPAICETEVLRI